MFTLQNKSQTTKWMSYLLFNFFFISLSKISHNYNSMLLYTLLYRFLWSFTIGTLTT